MRRTLASISNVRISPFIFSIRPVQYFSLPYSQFWVSQVDFTIFFFAIYRDVENGFIADVV